MKQFLAVLLLCCSAIFTEEAAVSGNYREERSDVQNYFKYVSSVGLPGPEGPAGPPGPPGPPGSAANSGVIYTRWGRTTCPSKSGAELVYSGRVGGSSSIFSLALSGGGANYLCMPDNPQYRDNFATGTQSESLVFGAEYQITAENAPLPINVHNRNVPCAVCYVQERVSVLMIPARRDCPTSWTKEYEGALMSAHQRQSRTMFECVDGNPETIFEESPATEAGVHFYHTEAACNIDIGLGCPPYSAEKELTCVVCTK